MTKCKRKESVKEECDRRLREEIDKILRNRKTDRNLTTLFIILVATGFALVVYNGSLLGLLFTIVGLLALVILKRY